MPAPASGYTGIMAPRAPIGIPFGLQRAPLPDSFCLRPLVESKPKGLSASYCLCSVGYIQELFSRAFGQPVTVELLDSVFRGGKRCKFKIEVAA
ncbi:MAG: DUF6144 family protein [Acidobacteriota bacterium]